MAGKHAKDTPPDEAPQLNRTDSEPPAGPEGVGARRSAEEAARLQDQDEAQRAAESGQD